MTPLRVLIATDTFKGSVPSPAVCSAIKRGLLDAGSPLLQSDVAIRVCPISDGGAGLIDVVCAAVPAMKRVRIDGQLTPLFGPLGEHLHSVYYAVNHEQHELVIEMAQAAGLPLVPEPLRNPLNTSSFGVGQLIDAAIRRETKDAEHWTVYLGIGGSSTNDGGLGALQALGLDVFVPSSHIDDDADSKEEVRLERPLVGRDLRHVTRLEPSAQFNQRFQGNVKIVLICDVDNPFVGPRGATRIYGPQKGATTDAILEELESGMNHVAGLIHNLTHIDVANMTGAGGAGGMSGSFACLTGAEWRCGADVVAGLVNLHQLVLDADLIITGEGSFDSQTLHHKKTAAKLAELVVQVNKATGGHRRVAVVCGRAQFEGGLNWNETRAARKLESGVDVQDGVDEESVLLHDVIHWVCPLTPGAFTVQEAMTNGSLCIEKVVSSEVHVWLEAFAT
ncbi:glycerate kinase, putative [Bodo saltans]|uniref:Glycerate kinase, putative n=1 Tax=Bodo saltans TaxID=75058 RepID=A0A0S4JG49_BODSA|nr:glycerate kinase, putative [Bodo saltans]|eukprot:CUG89482.1 glycerate kinase, putative [Bodo saltans]